uniref:Terminase small subunit n=1 Tax=Siphoviridae sp. ct5Px37 TaxID=2826293 RepID=A0A8S5N3H2_9CAUD|nr:MAG TPA: Terminase small subunit [Siphoviridae sp. ct5Px37]
MPGKEAAWVTEKQKRFCDEYLIDCNATQAAIRAGYSEVSAGRNANRMMKNDEIRSYIDAALMRLKAENVADAQEVMEYLTSVLRGKSQSSVLARDEIGAERVIEKPPDEKERLKAAELLGKRYGLYTDKVDLDADTELHINIDYGDDPE